MKRLGSRQAQAKLKALSGWRIVRGVLVKSYAFGNYHETMAFVNALAWISHRQDHHPDLGVGYNKVRVAYSTHDVGGLSPRDFLCAAQCDALFDR